MATSPTFERLSPNLMRSMRAARGKPPTKEQGGCYFYRSSLLRLSHSSSSFRTSTATYRDGGGGFEIDEEDGVDLDFGQSLDIEGGGYAGRRDHRAVGSGQVVDDEDEKLLEDLEDKQLLARIQANYERQSNGQAWSDMECS